MISGCELASLLLLYKGEVKKVGKEMKTLIVMISLGIHLNMLEAKTMVQVQALGSSPKGQYIAFEEFGYIGDAKKPFSRVKVFNVWKNKYVVEGVQVTPREEKLELNQVRSRAKNLAQKSLNKYHITF
jgi:predicted secreted protein